MTTPAPDLQHLSIDAYEKSFGGIETTTLLDDVARYDDELLQDANFFAEELAKSDLEARADADSLELLHHQRRMVLRELAPLAAIFEGGQTPLADGIRKQHRALVSRDLLLEMRARGELKKEAKDLSEAALERMANVDPRHVVFVQKLEKWRIRYVLLKGQLTELQEKIRNRELVLLAYTAELKLQPRVA